MNEGRFVIVDYCDDIRHEVGFKYSLMGCYSGELVTESLPITLPKLCASISVHSPLEKPLKSLTVRAFLGSEIIAEMEFPSENLIAELDKVMSTVKPDSTKLSLKMHMIFSPVIVSEQTELKIEAETEEGVIKGPKLIIRTRLSSDPQIVNN